MAAFIFLRVLLSVSSNTIQKRLLLDGIRVLPVWLATYALMLVPGVVLAVARPVVSAGDFWINVLLGGFLDAAGNLAMVAALRSTDLSIFGPLNAFRPVLALVFGRIFLGESPSLAGVAGVGVTVAGAVVLFGGAKETAGAERGRAAFRTMGFRLLGLSLSTIGAVFLKRAALGGSVEMTLCGWIGCGLICLVAGSFARGEWGAVETGKALKKHGSWLGLHALTFFAMQWLTISIFKRTFLAYSLAYFQLGMILQVVLGRLFFQEPQLRRRLAGAAIMCVGNGLLAWKG